MLWIVYGHRGWIGGMVVDYLKSLNEYQNGLDSVHLGESRLENYQEMFHELQGIVSGNGGSENGKFGRVAVMSFTGRTHGEGFKTIDYLEQPGKLPENLRDNLMGPMNLADICMKLGIYYTYLGTGCIYQYDSSHTNSNMIGFKETESPNFQGSAYSAVKGALDQLIIRYPNVLSCRIRLPVVEYSHPRNLISKLLGYQKVMTGVKNAISVLPTLIPIMIHMTRNREVGCYNLVNPGAMSHDEILGRYQEIVDSEISWETFSEEEQNRILACPRSNTCLDTDKLSAYCFENNLELMNLDNAVDWALHNWKKN